MSKLGMQSKVHDISRIEDEARRKRLGLKSEAEIAFEVASKELDDMEKLYLPIDTPPPDSLEGYERQIWTDTLRNAGEHYFRLTEGPILEEFCWTKARLLIARRSMGDVFNADEVRTMRSLQGALTNLGRMLRMSPPAAALSLREKRVELAFELGKSEAQSITPSEPTGVSGREGLMFGGDPHAVN